MSAIPEQLWIFRARCERVVDGDTVDAVVDQGMHAQRLERLRLLGVDAPETRGPPREAGLMASLFVMRWMEAATGEWPLVIQTVKSDAFGRYLADVWRVVDGRCLNTDLVESGHATTRGP